MCQTLNIFARCYKLDWIQPETLITLITFFRVLFSPVAQEHLIIVDIVPLYISKYTVWDECAQDCVCFNVLCLVFVDF